MKKETLFLILLIITCFSSAQSTNEIANSDKIHLKLRAKISCNSCDLPLVDIIEDTKTGQFVKILNDKIIFLNGKILNKKNKIKVGNGVHNQNIRVSHNEKFVLLEDSRYKDKNYLSVYDLFGNRVVNKEFPWEEFTGYKMTKNYILGACIDNYAYLNIYDLKLNLTGEINLKYTGNDGNAAYNDKYFLFVHPDELYDYAIHYKIIKLNDCSVVSDGRIQISKRTDKKSFIVNKAKIYEDRFVLVCGRTLLVSDFQGEILFDSTFSDDLMKKNRGFLFSETRHKLIVYNPLKINIFDLVTHDSLSLKTEKFRINNIFLLNDHTVLLEDRLRGGMEYYFIDLQEKVKKIKKIDLSKGTRKTIVKKNKVFQFTPGWIVIYEQFYE